MDDSSEGLCDSPNHGSTLSTSMNFVTFHKYKSLLSIIHLILFVHAIHVPYSTAILL